MNEGFLLAAIGTIQVTFASLDLVERVQSKSARHDDERVRPGTVAFLVTVTLAFVVIQGALMLLAPSAETLISGVRGILGASREAPGTLSPLAWVAITAVAFYGGGLADYLVHRFFNHTQLFWFTHEYHHLPKEVFVALPGLAVRPFSVFTVVPTAAVTVLLAQGTAVVLGAPLSDLRPLEWVAVLNAFVLTTSHSSFLRAWMVTRPGRLAAGAMRAFGLTTPQEHLVHHAVDRVGNYGNMTTIWDRLFGTWTDPDRAENQDRPLGLAYDQDFLGTLTFGRWKFSPRIRERFQLHRYCRLRDGGSEATLARPRESDVP
ncbi:MAG: sterol desaturase family protein [Myxococcales bacterium]|nr:sterol desaturase family protein [Myxococcales bacterium]